MRNAVCCLEPLVPDLLSQWHDDNIQKNTCEFCLAVFHKELDFPVFLWKNWSIKSFKRMLSPQRGSPSWNGPRFPQFWLEQRLSRPAARRPLRDESLLWTSSQEKSAPPAACWLHRRSRFYWFYWELDHMMWFCIRHKDENLQLTCSQCVANVPLACS